MDKNEQAEQMWLYADEDYHGYEERRHSKIAALNAALQTSPDNANLYIERGKERFMLGDFLHDGDDRDEGHELMSQAMADYDQAVALDPTNIRYLRVRAYFYHVQYKWEQAIADYNRIIELEPDNLQYRQTRATWCEQIQRYGEAIADYSHLIDLLNSKPDSWNITWQSLEQENTPAEIPRDGQTDKRWQGSLENLYRARARCYQAAKEYAQAIDDYTNLIDRGIVRDYRYDSLYVPRAQCYAALKLYPEALVNYDRAQQLNPWIKFDAEKAEIYKKMGDNWRAIAEYSASIDKRKASLPDQRAAGPVRSEEEILGSMPPPLREHLKNRSDIIARIQQASASPTSFTNPLVNSMAQSLVEGQLAELYRSRASEYVKVDRYEEAIADYDQAIQLASQYPNLADYINRGNAYLSLKRYEEAIADYNLVIARASNPIAEQKRQNDQHESETRSRIEEMRRAFQQKIEGNPNAQSLLQRWEENFANRAEEMRQRLDNIPVPNMVPVLKVAYLSRAISYTRLERLDDAIADFYHALELVPDDPGTLFNIACLYGRKHRATEALDYLKRALAIKPELRENARDSDDFGWLVEHDPQFAAEFHRLVEVADSQA